MLANSFSNNFQFLTLSKVTGNAEWLIIGEKSSLRINYTDKNLFMTNTLDHHISVPLQTQYHDLTVGTKCAAMATIDKHIDTC